MKSTYPLFHFRHVFSFIAHCMLMRFSPRPSLPLKFFEGTLPDEARFHWSHQMTLLSCLCLFAAWMIAAFMWPLCNMVVPWDSKNHFYPMLRYLGASLAGGEWPLWNPYHFSGHPTVADPQSLLFTPTLLLFGWLMPNASMEMFDAVVFAHLLLGALGIVAFFRHRGWHPAGALTTGLMFMLGGSASSRLQHTGMIVSYSFFPLALWLLDETINRRSFRFGVAFGVTAALMVMGRDQVAFLCAIALLFYAGALIATSSQPLHFFKSRILLFLVMGVTGAALLAVPVLLTLQFLFASNRPAFGFGVAAMGSLPPESMATFLFSNIFGSLRWTFDYWGPDWQSLNQGTWTDRSINYLFAGTIPALFILWHGMIGGRFLAKEVRFFVVLIVVALFYALGRYTPVFEHLFDLFPGINLYRRPADATFLMNIGYAYGAGYLFHRYWREGRPRHDVIRHSPFRAALVALTVIMIGLLMLGALRFAIHAGHVPKALQDIFTGCTIALAAILVVVSLDRSREWRSWALVILLAVTTAELIWRNAASSLNAETRDHYSVFAKLAPEQEQGLRILQDELSKRHERGERPRVEILGLGGAWQNASMVLELENTIGYNPLRLSDYERAVGPGENAADANMRHFPGLFRGYKGRLASLLGLEYVVLDRPVTSMPPRFPRFKNATLLYGQKSMWVYRLQPPAARAYLATRLMPVNSEDVLAKGELPEFDLADEALIEEGNLTSLTGDYGTKDTTTDPDGADSSLKIRAYHHNSVILEVDTDRNAVIVLHDLYYPGWEVLVNDVAKPLLRTNLLFRGVEVEPGHHRVEFRFRPLSTGNLMSAAQSVFRPKRNED